ncbi:biotin--protein ligase-like [Paramacrobiotus metropolitanus]|uniref:biotin--protein ligase-like n=1 Tax=Paramacrobiotus metropolitanus TaxID=2943436 RepID=UPI002445B878|nr:biotin--protein ligase-like [Paramacrobiotus metropolitanus]
MFTFEGYFQSLADSLQICLLKAGGVRDQSNQLIFPIHTKGARDESFAKICDEDDPQVELDSGWNFQSADYFRHTTAELLGNCVLFADRIPSTVHIIDRLASVLLKDINVVCVAAQQSSGKGRSGNVWESPLGCAMFSFPLVIPLATRLGQALTFVQHLVATACVLAVRNTPGYQDVDLRIKWPNDILTSDKVKVGGILVTSSIMNQTAYCNVGVGFNISNTKPTICLNELIGKVSSTSNAFSIERFIGRTLSELEKLLREFAVSGETTFLPLYLKYWLHMNQQVNIRQVNENPEVKSQDFAGKIIGLDKFGFLLVRLESGELWSVQSDGNRFDMMANLLLLQRIS